MFLKKLIVSQLALNCVAFTEIPVIIGLNPMQMLIRYFYAQVTHLVTCFDVLWYLIFSTRATRPEHVFRLI